MRCSRVIASTRGACFATFGGCMTRARCSPLMLNRVPALWTLRREIMVHSNFPFSDNVTCKYESCRRVASCERIFTVHWALWNIVNHLLWRVEAMHDRYQEFTDTRIRCPRIIDKMLIPHESERWMMLNQLLNVQQNFNGNLASSEIVSPLRDAPQIGTGEEWYLWKRCGGSI